LKLAKWFYDPLRYQFLIEEYQLIVGDDLINNQNKSFVELSEKDVPRKDVGFNVVIPPPKKPFKKLNLNPVTYESMEKILLNEVYTQNSRKIVDIIMED
jgi:hypothetical protein